MIKIAVETDPPDKLLGEANASALIEQVCVPEVAKFESWFHKKGQGGFTKLERELLTAFLFQKINGSF